MDLTEYKFFKFRYTLADGDIPRAKMYLQAYFLNESEEYYAACGYETLNKLNENTHPHLHMHFVVKGKTIGAIRKALQRDFKSQNEKRKGNVLYSLSEEEDVKDVNRFLRYVWKQGGRQSREAGFRESLPADMDVDLEVALAREEQERMWEFNKKKQAEALRPSTKDKLFEYLDGLNEQNKFSSKREILIKIMEYYNSEEKSANKQTIMGYLQTALWRYQMETFEETATEWLKH